MRNMNNNEFKLNKIPAKLPCETIFRSSTYAQDSIKSIISSDLMSDVLISEGEVDLLITSLATEQTIRTGDIIDLKAIIIVNNKEVTPEMHDLASDFDITIFKTTYSKYATCCKICELQRGE